MRHTLHVKTWAWLTVLCAIWCITPRAQAHEYARDKVRFSWGASLDGDVDLSSHDMSAIGIDAQFGFSYKTIRFLGIGAQADMMVSNSNRSIPLYVNFRTDFSTHRRLVFMDLRGGVSLNYFNDSQQETGAYASAGLGVTLSQSSNYAAHLIVGYTFLDQEYCYLGDYMRKCPGVSYATVRLGVTF